MAAAKQFSTERILAKLQEMEMLQAQGLSVPAPCQRLGISGHTFDLWRLTYGR